MLKVSRSGGVKTFLILLISVSLSQQRSIKEAEQVPFELDEILNSTFAARGWNGTWITDSTFVYKDEGGDILQYNITTKSSSLFLKKDIWDDYPGASVSLSPDLSYVLLTYNVSSVFRHSTTSQFTVYDIANSKYYDIADKAALQLVTFAPEGHGLVYVLENNIYYLEDFSKDIQNPITVTTAGITGSVYCGVPDWVYEEEVLSSGSALWFSPSATHIAYAVFHDEDVRNMTYTVYGEAGLLENQYPSEVVIRYPKVGTPNPIVSVYVYDIASKTTVEFQLPSSITNKNPNDYILYDLTWISNTEVGMASTNRVQNEMFLIRCLVDGTCEQESSRKETQGWIEPAAPHYSKDGTKRLEILPQPEGDDRFDHLVLTDVTSNTQSRLTRGRLTVLSIIGWDQDSGVIYYSATADSDPADENVYSIDQQGVIDCLTCSLEVDGVGCGYGAAFFSKSFSYYVKQCNGPNTPIAIIENVKDPNDVITWEDNSELKASLTRKSQPVIKNLVVPINDQFSARVRLFLPPNLDENSNKKYPALVDTYAGPNSNQISNSYNVAFKTYLVTNKEYIYIYIDGRGSGRDGYNKMYQVYKKFATVEIEDQIQITKYLQEHLPYIDAERTGIWGWSYGGFCSSWALAKDKDHVFKATLSVAPVTDFMLYDSIYTERYMGLPTPDDNEAGYNNTNLSTAVEAFRGRNYFIIHGTGDDNVHYQNSMLFVKSLELADIEFRQHSYPDENHSLGHVSRHLYHMMDKYWAEQFKGNTEANNFWNNKEIKNNKI